MKNLNLKKVVGVLGVVILVSGVVIFNAGKGKESVQKTKTKETQTVFAHEALPCEVKLSVSREPIVNRPFELKIKMRYDWAKKEYNYRFYFDKEKKAARVKILEGATEWVMGGEKREHIIKMMITEPGGYAFHVDYKRGDGKYSTIRWAEIHSAKSKGKVSWDKPPAGTKEQIEWDKEIAAMYREMTGKKPALPLPYTLYGFTTTFYYAPTGELKVWALYAPTLNQYGAKKWEKIEDPGKEKYLPLEYVMSPHLSSDSDIEAEQLLLAGKPAQALAVLKKVNEKDLELKELVILHNDLGIIHLALGDWKKGSEEIKKAAQIFRENYQREYAESELVKKYIYRNLAVVYAIEGNYGQALKQTEESMFGPGYKGLYLLDWLEKEKEKEEFLKKLRKMEGEKIRFKRQPIEYIRNVEKVYPKKKHIRGE